MNKKILILLAGCLIKLGVAQAQPIVTDTVTVMQYNLTNYGNITTYCTSTNNSVASKDPHIKTITKYVKPDIFGINEMNSNITYANRLLSLVLNTDGVTHYKRAEMTNTAGSDIVNMLFYNSDKLVLHSQETITAIFRDINLYRLYYKSPSLATTQDTVFLVCIVAHLKASNTSADAASRGQMTQSIINHLNAKNKADNYILMGDFNLYKASEVAYQNLITATNPKIRFYDPINQMGDWTNNSTYKAYHTQSTRVTSNGCLAGGGMDDRFDHIMLTQHLLNDSAGAKFIQGTYKAVGQDGNRFNGNINDGTNTSVPAAVANALFNSSDHLPVTAKFSVKSTVTSLAASKQNQLAIKVQNPVRDGVLRINIQQAKAQKYHLAIYSTIGQELVNEDVILENTAIEMPCNLKQGIYILRIIDENNRAAVKRLIVE